MYCIETKCSFDELYRYTTAIICRGYNSSDEELYMVAKKDAASEGEEFLLPQITTLQAEAADSLRVELHVIAHTFPESRNVIDVDPFNLEVTITREEKVVYSHIYDINRWGGISIYLEF